MRVCVFDLETSGLYANSSIVLCGVMEEFVYEKKRGIEPRRVIVRADEFKSWKNNKSDNRQVVEAIMAELCGDGKKHDGYDIFVAHNGQYFDKTLLNSACLKYGIPPRLRFEKFIDPVMLARKHMRIARNSLHSLIDYFDIEEQKTPIKFDHWLKASLDGNRKSMDYIVEHCEADVKSLTSVYRILRKLVKGIDEYGSGR